MKSDIEKLRDLCNTAIESAKSGQFRSLTPHDLLREIEGMSAASFDPIMRLGDFIILKPKKDL